MIDWKYKSGRDTLPTNYKELETFRVENKHRVCTREAGGRSLKHHVITSVNDVLYS